MNRQKIIALFAVSSLLSLHAYADSPASSLTSEDRTKAEVTVSADLYIEGNDDATTAALEVEGDALIQGDQYIRGHLYYSPSSLNRLLMDSGWVSLRCIPIINGNLCWAEIRKLGWTSFAPHWND